MRLSFNTVLNSIFHGVRHAKVLLDVNKKGPCTAFRKAFETITRIEPCFSEDPDRECYILYPENDGKYFSCMRSKYFTDKIYVLEEKQEEFLSLLQQLIELDICNVLEASAIFSIYVANIYSTIKINGRGIDYSFCRGFYNIKYDAQKDLITYKTKEDRSILDGNEDGLCEILKTRIPSYSIPDYYLNIIKKSDVDLDRILFENYLGRSGKLYVTNEDGKELILSKKIKR
jgi:hypothetical protein